MDNQAPRPYKRHIVIIKKEFQYKFILLVMACVAVAIAVIAFDVIASFAGASGAGELTSTHDVKVALLIKAVVYLAGVFLVSLVVSHRIAGPLYRLEKCVEQLALGDLSFQVHLREGDELQDS